MKDILVHLNNVDTLPVRLKAASLLATQFNAHITGVYVKQRLSYEVYGTFVHPDIVNETLEAEQETADKAKLVFTTQLLKNAPLEDAENVSYIEMTGDVAGALVRHSVVNDLVVLARGKKGDHFENLDNLAANVVLECGRPVLVVPADHDIETIGKSIFVAWNGTAESARAVHDAMPLLQAAEVVNVVTFEDKEKDASSVVDITDHLSHYGITFDVLNSPAKDPQIMENMFRLVDRFESDLVVMGAYGHSRFREYVLGGVSRSAISDLDIPLFLSH